MPSKYDSNTGNNAMKWTYLEKNVKKVGWDSDHWGVWDSIELLF